MKDKLFDTPEKAKAGIDSFTNLLSTPGWKLLEQIVDENIEVVTNQILSGGEKEDMDRLRDRLTALKDVIGTPASQIKMLKGSDSPAPSPDPYDQPAKSE